MPLPVTDEALRGLDLLQFNGGENPYNDNSVRKAFAHGVAFYRDIIRTWQMAGRGRVLDLLCGCGRWSLFLAEVNDELVGLDRKEGAVRIARGLADHFGMANATFFAGDVSETARFEDASFDAVWMWLALIYVERGPCLEEVYRILKPGGRLFVGRMNSFGRLLQKGWFGLRGMSPRHKAHRRQAKNALLKGPYFDGRPNYVTARTAGKVFGRHGFKVLRVEQAGPRVWGLFPESIHLLAEKQASPASTEERADG